MPTPIDINGMTIVALSVLLVAVVWNDVTTHRIENISVLAIILLGFFSQLLGNGAAGVIDWLGGMAVGLGFLLPFYIGGGMAAGDVKLLAAIGSILGPVPTLMAGGVTLIAGAGLGLYAFIRYQPSTSISSDQSSQGTPGTGDHTAAVMPRGKLRVPYAAAIAVGAIGGLLYSGRLQDFFGVLV